MGKLHRFEVERYIKGGGFEKIGSVRFAVSGSYYQFEDLEIVNKVSEGSIVYYRLKMVDKDVKYKYSPVVNVRISKVRMIASVYPNPFTDRLVLKLDALKSGSGSILITDLTGRVLINQPKEIITEGLNNLVIGQLNHLSKGTYLLKLVYNTETLVFEIVKH